MRQPPHLAGVSYFKIMNGSSTFTWFKLPTALITQPKFQRLSPLAQAGFVTLCCVYWQDSGVMTYEDAQMNAEGVDELIDKGYIQTEDGMISIGFLDEQIEEVEQLRAKKQAAGVKSAEARARKRASTSSADVEQVLNGCSTDKIRVNEIDEKKVDRQDENNAQERDGDFVEFEEVGVEQPSTNQLKSRKEKVAPKRKEVVLPWDSPNFKEKWQLWKEYKKKEHRFGFKSEHSEQMALKKLTQVSNGQEHRAVELIETAISNGWKGIYEVTQKPHTNGKQHPITEQLARDIANDIANGGWNFADGK